MKIRKATLKDAEEFFELFKLFYKDDEEIFLSGFLLNMVKLKKDYKNHVEKEFKSYLRSPKKIILFVEDNDKIIGFASGCVSTYSKYYQYFDKEGSIEGLFIKKGFRGKRVSSLLKNELLKWFKSKNLKYLGLEVFEKNTKAQKIYHKWGFKPFSRKMKLQLK